MPAQLQISVGQYSDKGRKVINQDFHGVLVPDGPLLGMKGIAVVLADGISSSAVSQVASESAVKSFLTDYYCTSETWSVKTSAQRVIAATNSWLHAQTRQSRFRYDPDKGYVCTFSAVVFKGNGAHLFHIGDARIYRISGASAEQLTEDHRVYVSPEQSYLGRGLGVNPQVEIDYLNCEIDRGDVFLLTTDGVHEFITPRFMAATVQNNADDLDRAARLLAEEAYGNGSDDNLTVQIVRIDALPQGSNADLPARISALPPAPLLEARMIFDGYRIVREIHASSRSHIYLAEDVESGDRVALKTPSIDLRDDADYLRRFMTEEWIARRIDSPHVLKPLPQSRRRSHLYVAMEYVDGQTLTQWMIDHPKPDLEEVRVIVEQIAAGLRAFHRKEMLHQDLRPQNILIDRTGTVKIIDFGSVRVAGVAELSRHGQDNDILGTVQYTAPEYFTGQGGSPQADQFSLGVIAYQMLTGHLPYGARLAQAKEKYRKSRLRYVSAAEHNPVIPVWVDRALQRAVNLDQAKRYESLSEFLFDLRHPNARYLDTRPVPLMARNPLLFWKCLSLLLALVIVLLLARLRGVGL
ncbi:bifunctional protein-serine/threonine kinase/phosphatase [Roseiarcaceae bacterium H3SJ34-1]|uniref:protein kinase domain-containing protein n=1 Tax=Terripilifer ovatus TaxID=3032367 RepID=UPI003AB999FA|nr:bifunctional protein-serine/threonine kinase/phosphatase [Roseiarcaceae bacterium H3SJ34-1]